MYKKAVLILALSVILFAGCGDGSPFPSGAEEMGAYEATLRMITELTSFRAVATVEYRSNKGTNTYETVQHARITGEYRVEVTAPPHVAGSITVSDNHRIFQWNSRFESRASALSEETPERSEIFLTSFIKNYLQSPTVSVSVSHMEEGVRTVLEAAIPGSHHYLHTARLYVCNSAIVPVQLVIADADGTERIIVTYHVFEKNIELSDALFTM